MGVWMFYKTTASNECTYWKQYKLKVQQSYSQLTHKSILKGSWGVGEHALKSHKMEDLVDCVVCSHNANVPETQRAASDLRDQEN